MIILKPTNALQTIQFIGRYDLCDTLVLRDEQDNTEVTLYADFELNKYYLSADITFDLQEDRFYNLTAYKSLKSDYKIRVESEGGVVEGFNCIDNYDIDRVIVYRDKIFCTSQDNYSINNGGYTQKSSNNNYITY